jgi:hypothetical protein
MIMLARRHLSAKPPLRSAVKSQTTEFYFTNHVLTGQERLCGWAHSHSSQGQTAERVLIHVDT